MPLDHFGEAALTEPVELGERRGGRSARRLGRPAVPRGLGRRRDRPWPRASARTGRSSTGLPLALMDGTRSGRRGSRGRLPRGHGRRVRRPRRARGQRWDRVRRDSPRPRDGGAAYGRRGRAPAGSYSGVTAGKPAPPSTAATSGSAPSTRTRGTVIGPIAVSVPGDNIRAVQPAIAAGDSALFVWEDDRGADVDLYGRRISSGLSFGDPAVAVPIVAAAGRPEGRGRGLGRRPLRARLRRHPRSGPLDRPPARRSIAAGRSSLGPGVDTPEGVALFAGQLTAGEPAIAGAAGNQTYVAAVFQAGPAVRGVPARGRVRRACRPPPRRCPR